ncbi:MAG: hypothetical protein F4057_08680 [Acidobacteria bacterium]|nr:hypothetical protein [Acidobacteriota bacterium]MYI75374.1 hypothetical protein [Acidobacteriota bacterium]
MRVLVAGALLAMLSFGSVVEAQTVAGRIQAVWDAEYGLYTYGPLYWDIEVAPGSAAADEFSMSMYYNKRDAFMSAEVVCRMEGEAFEKYARSYSGDHFLSLTTGLLPGNECVLFIVGANDNEEELAFRMAVAERVARSSTERDVSNADAGSPSIHGGHPAAVAATLRKLARAVADHRTE